MSKVQPLIVVDRVVKEFGTGKQGLLDYLRRKKRKSIRALDSVSLGVRAGETLVLLGESGSGKTTLGKLIVGLELPGSGRITLRGKRIDGAQKGGWQRGRLQMVFQDPSSSLDRFMSVYDCVAEPLTKMRLDRQEVRRRVSESLRLVSLEEQLMNRRTSELSGGQRQRVAIARSLVSEPDVVVLDEPTSSIDVSIQAQVLNLLVDIQRKKGLAYVLITHDPNVARFMADTVAVIYLGKVMEYGSSERVLGDPKHPYTKSLLSASPKLSEPGLPPPIKGEPPSMIDIPAGCRFHPRCPFVMENCKVRIPLLEGDETKVACFLYHGEEEVSDVQGERGFSK
jgi:oligopeptide/dipeptide ABC transporter ATP-binding protein